MKKAFSLVELSIVLVILGLLTGGILAGKSLIRAAELRSVTTQLTKYRTAFYSFRDKYFALPGDMTNAVRIWGAQAGATTDGADTTCYALTAAATGTATCNGNGDATIAGTTPQTQESYRAWQQLANAGLIEGTYSGVAASGVPPVWSLDIGTNSPAGKIGGTGFTVRWYQAYDSTNSSYFAGPYGNMLWFGTSNTTYTNNVALSPEEAWNIDTKADDGMPALGIMLVPESQTTCHTDTESTSVYKLSSGSTPSCSVMFLLKI